MLTYQDLYERCQSMSSDTDSTTLTLFKVLLNEGMKKVYSVLNADRFYFSATDLTVASQKSYPLPAQSDKIHTIETTISSTDYIATEFPGTEEQWITLTGGVGATESDYPTWFYVKKDTIELYPTPSTAGYTMTIRYKVAPKNLSADNHTTQSIKTATVGSTAIVGNTGTTWTSAMAGRYLKVTSDGVWYKIASVTDATNLVLTREFAGTAIVAGTEAYIIGECSLIPESYQETPVHYALYRYYAQKENLTLSAFYKNLWEDDLLRIRTMSNDTTSGIITEKVVIKDKNDYPVNLS